MTQPSSSLLQGMTPDELRAELDRRLAVASALEAQVRQLTIDCERATEAVGEVMRALMPPPLLNIMEGK